MWTLKRETVRGRPIRMGAREIVPEARVWLVRTGEAVIGQDGEAALHGGLWLRAAPTALFDRAPERTYRVPIVDVNRRLEGLLLAAALALPLVLNVAAGFARQARGRPDTKI